jgi:hypothetical protein
MRNVVGVLLIVMGCIAARGASAEDLADLLASGKVRLENTTGTGASSGSALEGELVNATQATIEVSVRMDKPLYFANGGVGQNMVAVSVFGRDGGYKTREGEEGFVEVARGARLPVTFVAYCADFEKENPTPSERFSVSTPASSNVLAVAKLIAEYEAANSETNNVAAMQFFLWRSQGVSAEKIREKFAVAPADEQVANGLLEQLQ